MKKKFLLTLLAIVCALGCAFGLAACNNNTTPKVSDLLIAKSDEQPNHTPWVDTEITYGETPDLTFYKLYLFYNNGDTKELALNDDKLTVEYSYYSAGTGVEKIIETLPNVYLAGSYSIKYTYDGNPNYAVTATINVNHAESGAFIVQSTQPTWYADKKTPNVIIKNPKGADIQKIGNAAEGVELQAGDTNGEYELYAIKKEVYDTFTEAQKTDWEFIYDFYTADNNAINNGEKDEHEIFNYFPDTNDNLPIGNYMLFAMIARTHNYWHVVTQAVEITVKDMFIERTFTFQNIVVQDNDGNTVTDTENEFVNMANSLNTANQGKTVICKTNGEVRGTVDFGAGAFDDLTGNDIYTYESGYNYLRLYSHTDGNKQYAGNGEISGNTFTLKVSTGTSYDFVITFSCS